MFYLGLIVVCVVMLAIFFGVTIAGGRAHDRQNRDNALKNGHLRSDRDDQPVE